MTKSERTIAILKRGYTTSLECARNGGVLSLSQRVGELRQEVCKQRYNGHYYAYDDRFVIYEKWVKTKGGARVKAWKITKDRAEE